MIEITQDLNLNEDELQFRFVLSSGPGGQNVNKVATAVQLRFDLAGSPSLPEDMRRRAIVLAGSRISKSGELVITANRYRSQMRNREDATERLVALLKRAAVAPKRRLKTKPTRAAKERRLEDKRKRSGKKQARATVRVHD